MVIMVTTNYNLLSKYTFIYYHICKLYKTLQNSNI